MKKVTRIGTALLFFLVCIASAERCLNENCSDDQQTSERIPASRIRDIFSERRVERESRVGNIRGKVGSERMANNRRRVDSDLRLSNFRRVVDASEQRNNQQPVIESREGRRELRRILERVDTRRSDSTERTRDAERRIGTRLTVRNSEARGVAKRVRDETLRNEVRSERNTRNSLLFTNSQRVRNGDATNTRTLSRRDARAQIRSEPERNERTRGSERTVRNLATSEATRNTERKASRLSERNQVRDRITTERTETSDTRANARVQNRRERTLERTEMPRKIPEENRRLAERTERTRQTVRNHVDTRDEARTDQTERKSHGVDENNNKLYRSYLNQEYKNFDSAWSKLLTTVAGVLIVGQILHSQLDSKRLNHIRQFFVVKEKVC